MTNNLKIFLLCGKAGTGKNLVADIIKEYYDKKQEETVITIYAKYIKLFAKELTNWDGSEEAKPRTLLQDLGSLARKKLFNNNFFVDRMVEDIKIYSNFVSNVVVADVRFPLEIDSIRSQFNNVYAIKINRENFISALNEEQQKDITETALDNYSEYDYIINNDSDEKDLENKVYEILGGIE